MRDGTNVRERVWNAELLKDVAGMRGLVWKPGELGRQQRDGDVLRTVRKVGLALPGQDVAAVVERGRVVMQRRGAFWIPPVLVVSHPLDAHRQSGFLRDQRCVRGGILVPVASVAARTFDVD